MASYLTIPPIKVLDMEKIASRLFEDSRIRQRICSDFGIEEVEDHLKLADRLVWCLGQERPCGFPETGTKSNSEVFCAAALAIASNMRIWSRFLERKEEFEQIVENYNPIEFTRVVNSNHSRKIELEKCLGGQTAKRDTSAIVNWAQLLSKDSVNYYNELVKLENIIENYSLRDGSRISQKETTPIMAAFLGNPKAKRQCDWCPPLGLSTWKAPGMGIVLASEFLRNLFWQGFKPDRHVERLLKIWFPEIISCMKKRASILAAEILFCRARPIVNSIAVSLVGAAVTPDGTNYNRADNLVWALGSYKEKKGKESPETYWMAKISV